MTSLAHPAEIQDDETLLRRFVARREADAFAELARRHAGLVYGTCLRVTGDRHDAEELTQESFLRLASRATTIRASVAGWLHATATRLSLNAVRARGRRRAHERKAVREEFDAAPDPSPWREVEPVLDEAVDSLPDELREAIVLHFLRSLPQAKVAARLGVHQSTVSRRVSEGLRRLHERLTASGVSLASVPLADVLAAAANPSGVPDVSAGVARAALAGAAGGAIGGAGAAWAKLKGLAFAATAGASPAFVETVAGIIPGALTAAAWVAFLAWYQPRWMDDLFPARDGRSHYHDPFYPFRRWTWEVMPAGWKRRMGMGFAIAAMFWIQAWALGQPRPGGGGLPFVGVWIVYGLLSFSTAIRIAWKAVGATSTMKAEPTRATAPFEPGEFEQSLGMALALPLVVPCLSAVMLRGDDRPAVLATMLVPLVLGSIWVWVEFARNLRRFRRDRTAPMAIECPPARGTWPRRILLAVMLGLSLLMAVGPLAAAAIASGNPQYAGSPQGSRHLEGARGMQPAMALLFLAATIRPLMLARSSMPRRAWLGAVAFAALLAMIDVAACLAYLGSLMLSG
ncbi:sigma-70 family RNA polymerase sigma factor [Paludisphaera sp.]|uniref:RNA polymerase sigma factor n=1 Tax=Paludisphaera sp. TaxID=2017432 RepID=UPI00301CE495